MLKVHYLSYYSYFSYYFIGSIEHLVFGQSTVEVIVKAGGNAAIVDRNESLARELVQSLGPSANFFSADVSYSDSVASAVKDSLVWIKETQKEIWGVVTAAGVSNLAKIIDKHGDPLSMDGFDFVMTFNVRGSIDLVRQCLPHLTTIYNGTSLHTK